MNDFAEFPTSLPALSVTALTAGALTVTGVATFAATVTATGQFLAAAGSPVAPSYSFAGQPAAGIFYNPSTAGPTLVAPGSQVFLTCDGNLGTNAMVSGLSFCAYSGTSGDLIVTRDAANVLAQRRGTNAQVSRIYGTYTSGSVYERLAIGYQGGAFKIVEEQLGASSRYLVMGTNGTGNLQFQTAGTVRWQIDSSGHLLPVADNTYDIGAGAAQARDIYASRYVFAGYFVATGAGAYMFNGRGGVRSSADGVLRLSNDADSDFGRLCFGGTTNAYPALKRSSSALLARLADDSGYAGLEGGTIKAHTSLYMDDDAGGALTMTFGTTNGVKIGTASGEKIGFYGATPVAQQTGVAVSAAGIHAALVALGLITA